MPRTRTPVAIGSSVPAWPTLRVAHSRRPRPTTSWLVQPDGLSTTSRPSGAGIRAGVLRAVRVVAAAVVGLVGLVVVGLGLAVRVRLPRVGGTGRSSGHRL